LGWDLKQTGTTRIFSACHYPLSVWRPVGRASDVQSFTDGLKLAALDGCDIELKFAIPPNHEDHPVAVG
jgi:hypothetical protein